MSDTCDDVSAESKAALIVDIVERTGLTPAEALHRIERLEQVLEDISDSDGWEDDA